MANVILATSAITKQADTPLDVRTRINNNTEDLALIAESIIAIGNPFVGQKVYNIATNKTYRVKNVTTDMYFNINVDIELDSNETISQIEKSVATDDDIDNIFIND